MDNFHQRFDIARRVNKSTGAAILGMAWYRTPLAIAVGLAVIVAPHVFGAPVAPEEHSDVPAHLATAFAAAALTASLVYWMAAGVLTGWFSRRLGVAE